MLESNGKDNRVVLSFDEFMKMGREGNLIPGPIRHQALSPEATERARRVYRRGGHLICDTFEQWERGFLRELNPEHESPSGR